MKKITFLLFLFSFIFQFSYSITTEEIVKKYDEWLKVDTRSLIEGKFINSKNEVISSRLLEQWVYNDDNIMKKAIAIYRPASSRGTRYLLNRK